ncbi:MAG TPA: hypothetical protein VIP46_16550 [Pyrinomonadaceae bacterium]
MSMPLSKTEILLALWLLLCVSAPAAAQGTDDYPANWCRNGLFPSDEAGFRLAKVGGNRTARVHFFNDDDDCPRSEAKCETKRYLVTGDRVLVSRTYGRWVCGWYQPRRGGETVGWLPADKLVLSEPPARPALANWVGLWKYAGKSLDIRRDGKAGLLKVKGDAVWEGVGGNVHVGGVEAAARPEGDELVLVEEECRVSLKLVGDYLVAKDNSECGGMNVRLNGVFRKGR